MNSVLSIEQPQPAECVPVVVTWVDGSVIGIEVKEACDRATDVLTAVFEAYSAGEQMWMDAAQLAVMHDLHDQQRALCTHREYIEVIGNADAIIQASLHRNLHRHT